MANTKRISKTVSSNESTKNPSQAIDSGSKPGMTKGGSLQNNSYPQMAGFGERFLAFFLDNLLLGFAIGIVSNILSVFFVGGIFTGVALNSPFAIFSIFPLIIISIVLSVAMTTFYYGYFYINKKGQSLGKKVLNIKVVKSDLKSQITWGDIFLREVIGKDLLNRLVFYLGYLWYFMSPKRQTWADSIASTIVVKADSKANTLMGGPKEYAKKPLITFSWCGCMLLWVILVVGIFIAVVTFAISEAAKQPNPTQNTSVDYRYNKQINESEDFDDALNEFKKLYEEEYNKTQDQSL